MSEVCNFIRSKLAGVTPKQQVTTALSFHYDKIIAATKAPRKTRSELAKLVDADYYGYRDEEDGIIVPLEQEMEEKGQSSKM